MPTAAVLELAPGRFVGAGHDVFVIAEGGLNHQGDVAIAKQLIGAAKTCGADAIKFQKRTIAAILTKAALAQPYTDPRKSFGPTYGEHRAALELGEAAWRSVHRKMTMMATLVTRGVMASPLPYY